MTRPIDFDNDDDASRYEPMVRRQGKAGQRIRAGRFNAPRESEEGDSGFHPTFRASKHERTWILNYLGPFFDDRLITDVLHQVKGGKEATVYCCRAHPATGERLLAAKVYRPREFRSIRNDALYREGRLVTDRGGKHIMRDRRALAAVAGKTKMGLEILHATWLGQEYNVMKTLHAAGAHVPKPWARGDNAILMDYVGDVGRPAPTLHGAALEPSAAARHFETVMASVRLMLRHGIVHGDLSAYNILLWLDRITLIDFPQAVDTTQNSNARALFERDVARVCAYFARHGVQADASRLADDLWRETVQLGYG